MNKLIIIIIKILMLSVCFTSCEYDNYDPPKIKLSGNITYNGKALGLKNAQILLKIYEDGWPLKAYDLIAVNQNGEFNALLYPGSYTLLRTSGVGPWLDPLTPADSIKFNITRDTVMNIEVTPYFTIDNLSIKFNANKDSVNGSFTLTKIAPATIEKIGLYIGRLLILDINNNAGLYMEKRVSNGININGTNNIVVALTDALKNDSYIFARIGVKVTNRQELIYSPVIKLEKQ
jgi:hypothetical protein